MIDRTTVLRRADDVRFRAVDDETVVVRQEEAEALVLNEVAGRILDLADGRRQLGEILECLHDEYEVEVEILQTDLEEYVGELVRNGVLLEV